MASACDAPGPRLLALALALTGTSAAAQSASVAQALFDEGRRLVKAGNYRAACAKFAESERLEPAGGTLMNLAACHEHTGQTASAWLEFQAARSIAQRSGRADRVEEANRRLSVLEPKLARIEVGVDSPPPGLEVRLDETTLASASWGTAIPVDPGPHEIRATATARVPWRARANVDPGALVRIEVPSLPVEAAPASTSQPITQPTRPRTRSAFTYALGSAGLTALLWGGYFGLLAAARKHESESHCVAAGCTPAGVAALRDANTAAWAADVNIGVGALATAGAVLAWFVWPARSSWHIAALPGRHALGLEVGDDW